MGSFYTQAMTKLDGEAKTAKLDRRGEVMKSAVLKALKDFCDQDEEFCQAIVQGGTFEDCMGAVSKGVGQSISDLDAYTRAVQFYFPGAEIRYSMTIDLIGAAAGAESVDAETDESRGLILDISSFL